jgi:acetyl-CoA carboxylase/biotin carboxylase 1
MFGSDHVKQKDFFSSVKEFVEWSDGDHVIEKVLIANNGIGATKAIRSIRKWSYETFGNERKIQFVVMATPEDMKANAEYIRMADQVVDVPGGTNNKNYANISLICEIAERLKVDAVMPMWGHASENPSLPISLSKLKHRVRKCPFYLFSPIVCFLGHFYWSTS